MLQNLFTGCSLNGCRKVKYRYTSRPMACQWRGLPVTKFFHWLMPRNTADCSISFNVDSLDFDSLLDIVHPSFPWSASGLDGVWLPFQWPQGGPAGWHSSHMPIPYLNCASSINCRKGHVTEFVNSQKITNHNRGHLLEVLWYADAP